MSYLDPKTRHPMPPNDAGRYAVVPREVPWDTPIVELRGLHLSMQCEHCHGRRVDYPLRLLAARIGWKVTLRSTVNKFRCEQCGGRPTTMLLIDRPDPNGYNGKGGSLDLLNRSS